MDVYEVRAEIREEVGSGVYAPYKTERYALPPEVVRLFCDVVIVEFLKGFFDFESIGQGLRSKIASFVASYRTDPKLTQLELGPDVGKALALAKSPNDAEADEARQRVTQFLIDYGIDSQLSAEHSAVITQSLLRALAARGTEGHG
jgi:hypothetical protein